MLQEADSGDPPPIMPLQREIYPNANQQAGTLTWAALARRDCKHFVRLMMSFAHRIRGRDYAAHYPFCSRADQEHRPVCHLFLISPPMPREHLARVFPKLDFGERLRCYYDALEEIGDREGGRAPLTFVRGRNNTKRVV